MFCKKCGSPIGQKDKFCKKCEAAEIAEKIFIRRMMWKSFAISVLTVVLGVGGVAVGLFFLPHYINLETIFEHTVQTELAAAPLVFAAEETDAFDEVINEYTADYDIYPEDDNGCELYNIYILEYAGDDEDEADYPPEIETEELSADDEDEQDEDVDDAEEDEEMDEEEADEEEDEEENEDDEVHPFEQIIRITSPGAFVLDHSSQRELTVFDLEGLTPLELRIARNEIYARHGRIFVDDVLRDHFNQMPWYVPVIPPRAGVPLSELERANVDFIREFEELER